MLDPVTKSRAPMRIGLAGGGTDLPAYSSLHDSAVISIAINRYAFATLGKTEHGIRLQASSYQEDATYPDLKTFNGDRENDILRATMKEYLRSDGVDASLFIDAPPCSGLGSSAAAFVALLSALNDSQNLGLSRRNLAMKAWELERNKLGNIGGYQDYFASTFGGVGFLQCGPSDIKIEVNRVPVGRRSLMELESRSLLFYYGPRNASGRVLEGQIAQIQANDALTIKALQKAVDYAHQIHDALLDGDITVTGRLLDLAWREKRRYSSDVSTPEIDELYRQLLEAGALGGKICGAGGGGHMFVICEEGKTLNVWRKLKERGFSPSFIGIDEEGVKTWTGKRPAGASV